MTSCWSEAWNPIATAARIVASTGAVPQPSVARTQAPWQAATKASVGHSTLGTGAPARSGLAPADTISSARSRIGPPSSAAPCAAGQ